LAQISAGAMLEELRRRGFLPITNGAQQGFARLSAAAMVEELRRRGFVVIVYTPKELIEAVEDLDLPHFDSTEWLAQHRDVLETFEREELRHFLRRAITG
jgi:uncharacterized protein (DUF2461 family)